MRVRRLLAVSTLVLGCVATPSLAQAHDDGDGHVRDGHSIAVIGNIPYGDAQVAALPGWIDQINAARPEMVFHLGDIKNGSSRCDEAYYRLIRSDFDRFRSPLVYTPGDNEWTDCHRANNGAYQPLERLALDRSMFFDRPGHTLGQKSVRVASQAAVGFPENVQLRREDVDLAVIHVVGSNNDLQPWTGIGRTTATPEQVAEEQARMANAIKVVRSSFATARQRHDRAVVLMQQADMFDPTFTPTANDISAFAPLVRAIVDEASRFRGQVYLFNGDSHVFNVDRPLATGSTWLATYGVSGSADNLRRITVDGSSNNVDWLKVTIHEGRGDALTWERVPFAP